MRLWRLIFIGIFFAALIGFILGQFGEYNWFLDLWCHFQLQYFIVFALGLALFLAWDMFGLSLLALVLSIATLSNISPYIALHSVASNGEPSVRAMFFNMYVGNTRYKEIRDMIDKEKPDVVVFSEVAGIAYEDLRKELGDYPNQHFELGPNSFFDLALFSKLPLKDLKVHFLAEERIPTLDFVAGTPDGDLRVLSAHTRAPMSASSWSMRNDHLVALAKLVSTFSGPVLVGGDFNTTPWSSTFKDLINTSGLTEARLGRGILPSWSSELPIFARIPIDQVLVSKDIQVIGLHTARSSGSDHLPIVVDLKI